MEKNRGVPITFVLRNRARDWPDIDALGESDIARFPRRFVGGRNSWIAQTYVRVAATLRERGFEVRASERFIPGTLCIAHRDDANDFAGGAHRSFLVVVRADRAPVHACDLAIIQNNVGRAVHERFIPLWPQPGLIARDPARGSALRRLAYHGRLGSAPAWFDSPRLRRELAQRRIAFDPRAARWDDYGAVDVALAARDEAPSVLATKPATKLYNAWLAGVPLLAMPEPAYLELRRSPFDFIEIRSEEDVLRAIDRLQRHPELYREIVQNGLRRASEFGVERTRERWLAMIEDEAVPAFVTSNVGTASRRAWHLGAMVRQKAASRGFKAHVSWQRWMARPDGPSSWMPALRAAFTREVPGGVEALAEPSNAQR